MSVDPSQRHTKANRCPVCDGADGDPRGKGHRCGGFTSGDYVHCSREELAGSIAANNAGLFAHYMHGACKCGQSHGAVRPTKEIVATYDYTDESGALLFQVVRFAPKDFRQRTPDGAGGWTWSTSGVARVPYRLQAIVEDDADRTVYIVEGEKDVETLEQLGYLATCNPGGAGKWGAIVESARRVLADRDIVIVADRDDVGRKHAASVEASLTGIARSIRVLECPSRKDVSDHVESGGRIEDLVPMGSVVDLFSREEQAFRLRWPRLTATDLSAPLAPVPWVCEALGMAPGAVTIVGGAGFGGKTVSMQAFLLAVASGSKAWGFYDVAQGRAVHIDYEQDRPLTQLRYQRIARTMRIDIRSLEGRLEAYCLPTARLDDEKAYDELVRILDGARIAIVDAFRGAFPSAKENDSGVRHFLDMLQRVSRATGCMIVVIAHSRKLNDDVDIRSSLRGSGALFDASQTVYMLDGSPKKMTRVTNTKDRWLGETRETFGLRIRDEMSADPSITDRRWGLAVEYAAPCEVQAEYIASEANDDITIAMNAARLTTIGSRVLSIIGSAPDGIMLSTLKGITAGIGSAIDLSAVTHDLVAQGHVDVDGRGPSSIYRRKERSISVIPTPTATATTTTTPTPTATATATTTTTPTPTATADIEGVDSLPRSEHPATRGGGRDPSA